MHRRLHPQGEPKGEGNGCRIVSCHCHRAPILSWTFSGRRGVALVLKNLVQTQHRFARSHGYQGKQKIYVIRFCLSPETSDKTGLFWSTSYSIGTVNINTEFKCVPIVWHSHQDFLLLFRTAKNSIALLLLISLFAN